MLLEKGIKTPNYNRSTIIANTEDNPKWVHFGAGNIFRAYIARLQQELLNEKIENTGIIVAEGYDEEIINKVNLSVDNLTIAVTLKSDGTTKTSIIGSVVQSLNMNDINDFGRLEKVFANKSLQMASFTITEKGYSIKDQSGNIIQAIQQDYQSAPSLEKSYIGKIVALCYYRYKNGGYPIALVSMDNCSENGAKLFLAVSSFANAWCKTGVVEKGFLDYINDPKKVGFPWSMIDKITPQPDEKIKQMLENLGFEGIDPIITAKNTYVAPFVNAEETEYLVIEDWFPNGRQKFDKAGVIFTDRQTVSKVEMMKVSTSLNPLHTALAIFGCLLGYEKISEEMKDIELVKLIKRIGYTEGLPVVVDPGIINPREFIDTVINVRLPNKFMPDTPQRIATNTSQKLAVRFGKTIQNYAMASNLEVNDLIGIPLVIAGWLRYLMGTDDNGIPLTLSPDPMLNELMPILKGISKDEKYKDTLTGILAREEIFGLNLNAAGISEKIIDYFSEMVEGKNAVRNTLIKYL